MKNEVEGDHIVEFVSGGAKNYAYKTAGKKTECKVRGFTLNVRGKEVLNFETVKKTILSVLKEGKKCNPSWCEASMKFDRVLQRSERQFDRIEQKYDKLTNPYKDHGSGYDGPVPQVGEDTATEPPSGGFFGQGPVFG